MGRAKRLKCSNESSTASASPNDPKVILRREQRSDLFRPMPATLPELRAQFDLDEEVDNQDQADSIFTDISFNDSAYASMTTTHEDGSKQDRKSLGIAPSRKRGRPTCTSTFRAEEEAGTEADAPITSITPSKRLRRKPSNNSASLEDELVKPASRSKERDGVKRAPVAAKYSLFKDKSEKSVVVVQTVEDVDDEANAGEAQTRSSGRARKKSQKQVEAEESDTIRLASRGSSVKRTPAVASTDTAVARRSKPDSRRISEPTPPEELQPTDSQTQTPARKRGRPKGSKNIVTPSRVASNIFDFEDIPAKVGPLTSGVGVTTTSKAQAKVYHATLASEQVTPSKKRRRTEVSDLPISYFDEEPEPMPINDAVQEKEVKTAFNQLNKLLQDPAYGESYAVLRDEIVQGLIGKRRFPLVGLDSEYAKVYQLLEQTVVAGEGNSMLVIGARGSAKSTLVESVLAKLTSQYSDDFHVVRLNGFLHTDDKLALKEIWRQLGKEMDVEDDATGVKSNYADTLASLLALLSHTSELSDQDTQQTSKSVIFIMDEFELFASHPRQTLLYNLFDIAQSRKAPIAVFGLTTKIDVVETLEKRVKSRFSHRYVHLSLPKTYPAFLSICRAALRCNPSTASDPPPPLSASNLSRSSPTHRNLLSGWTTYVTAILASEPMSSYLHCLYHQTKSIPTFLTAALLPILLSTSTSPPTSESFLTNFHALEPPDSKLPLLRGLADAELAILIAATRLDIILDADACNFNMAYEEYLALTNRARITSGASGTAALSGVAGRVWGRGIALGAWERLGDIGLLVPVTGAGSGSGGVGAGTDLGRRGRLWRADIALEEIGASGLELGGMGRWCKEITL